MKHGIFFTCTLLGCLALEARAGQLSRAEVTKVVNDVQLVDPAAGARAARASDIIMDDKGLKTGGKSRAELRFQDDTLARLGADTFFSFKPGTRDLNLGNGSMLLQVPKGLGGTRIRSAAVTAAITGTTIMVENQPGSHFKVIVLEGSLRLSLNQNKGQSVDLTAGKMAIVPRGAKTINAPVEVDLSTLVKTSGLMNSDSFQPSKHRAPLASIGLINKEITQQNHLLARQDLVSTGQVIRGSGAPAALDADSIAGAINERIHSERAATEKKSKGHPDSSGHHLSGEVAILTGDDSSKDKNTAHEDNKEHEDKHGKDFPKGDKEPKGGKHH